MSLMEAMTGLSLDRIWISRHMRSLASASPPGESTRSTTALMFCGQAIGGHDTNMAPARIRHVMLTTMSSALRELTEPVR